MAGKKPIQGILRALDDELGLGLFRAGRSTVPHGVTITKRPKDLEAVHPDVVTGTGPLREMYHGSSNPVPYDRPISDPNIGLHLADNPDIATEYSLGPYFAEEGHKALPNRAGPRIYPMLVDPGNMLSVRSIDPDWWDPESFSSAAQYAKTPTEANRITEFANNMRRDETVVPAMNRLGIDSLETLLRSPLTGDLDTALLLPDWRRAVPKASTIGNNMARVRGVLTPHPSDQLPYNKFLERFGPETLDEATIPNLQPLNAAISSLRWKIKNSSNLSEGRLTQLQDELQGYIEQRARMLAE